MANKGKINKKGFILIIGGLLLIVAALFLVGYNLWEESNAQRSANDVAAQLTEKIQAQIQAKQPSTGELPSDSPDNTIPMQPDLPDYVLNPDMEMPVETIKGRDYIGVVEIPSYNLVLPVVSEWSDSNLKVAPCRYVGSVYKDNLIIAGHNYRSHFSNIKKLQPGDTVIFTDMAGNVFTYKVILNETLQSNAVEEMKSGDWDLSLFTCNYGGSVRVTIRCEKIDS